MAAQASPPSFAVANSLLRQAYSSSDPAFSYQGIWDSGTQVGLSSTFIATTDPSATVSFTFPVPAIALTFYGKRQTQGGNYSLCFDCPSGAGLHGAIVVDGLETTDDGTADPVALFTCFFGGPPAVHQVIMYNSADSRGTPAGNSQLALASFVLDVKVTPTPTSSASSTLSSLASSTVPTITVPPPTLTTSSSSPSLPTSADSSSLLSSLQSPSTISPKSTSTLIPSASTPSSTSTRKSVNSQAIAGSAAGVVAALAILILLFFWRRRWQRTHSPNAHQHPSLSRLRSPHGDATAMHPTTSAPAENSAAALSAAHIEEKPPSSAYANTRSPASGTYTASTSARSATYATEAQVGRAAAAGSAGMGKGDDAGGAAVAREEEADVMRVRARDAGPLENLSDLPPEYGTIFPGAPGW